MCRSHFLGALFLKYTSGKRNSPKSGFFGAILGPRPAAQTKILQKVRHMNTHSLPGGEFRAKNQALTTWDHSYKYGKKVSQKGL